ncbi:MAG TPA: hypothetical protein VMC80_03045 [Patescibacteria group bacterium]|nr:hypothetical protein [Patescibacteria group bacterium]
MAKRILVFSRDDEVREEIVRILEDYYAENFSHIRSRQEVPIQDYETFTSPSEVNRLGHWDEVFCVIDQQVTPRNLSKEDGRTLYQKSLKSALEASIRVCESKGIPYLIYRGEFARNNKEYFITRLKGIGDRVKERLI